MIQVSWTTNEKKGERNVFSEKRINNLWHTMSNENFNIAWKCQEQASALVQLYVAV
jgi:hypothetical protein